MKKIVVLLLCLGLMLSIAACMPQNAQEGGGDSSWNGARWIWDSAELDEQGYAKQADVWMDFRRDFTLDQVPGEVKLKLACDSKYWLYVNGTEVVWEGGLRRGPMKDGVYGTYYDIVDIGEYLKTGENNISVQVWFWGGSGTHDVSSGSGGLILSSELIDSTNGNTIRTGDGEWWTKKDPAYSKDKQHSSDYFAATSVLFDGALSEDWMSPDYTPAETNGWRKAVTAGEKNGVAGCAPWNFFEERPIPMLKDYGRTVLALTEVEGSKTVKDDAVIRTYVGKLPYNAQMVPYIIIEDAQGGETITIYSDTYEMSQLRATYVTKTGSQEFESKSWISGDFLFFEIPETVTVKETGFHETGYDVQAGENTWFQGYFDSILLEDDPTISQFTGGWNVAPDMVNAENNFYDELWNKAARTLYVTIRDSYMDCPDRERGQYIGDAVNEMEEAYYALGVSGNAISAKAIRNICEAQYEYEANGRTYYYMSNVRPGTHKQEIQIQTLGTAYAAWEYYLYTGDTSVAVDCYQALFNYLTNYDLETEGAYAGTIKLRTKETYDTKNVNAYIADWSDWGSNQDLRIEYTAWWYLSADSVRKLADVPGVSASAEDLVWLDERLATVKNSFDCFWNEELSAYATDWETGEWREKVPLEDGSHVVDERVNALAVVAGLAPEERYKDIRALFMGTDTKPAYQNASIYMEKYVLEALYRMGYAKDAMERMALRHMADVNDDTASTLPEYFGKGPQSSKNHGWSGGSLTVLSAWAAGIRPTDAGYQSWQVVPQLGSFQSIDVRVPAEIGLIDLTISVVDGRIDMKVTSPGGSAELWVPMGSGGSPAQIAGEDAEYLGERTAFGGEYAVYQISEAGTYDFTSATP